jgi:hypothetical protein
MSGCGVQLRQRLDATDKAIGVATRAVREGLNTVHKCSNDEPSQNGGEFFFNAIDPDRTPTVRRSIRDNVGNRRPTARDPLLNHLIGDGQQGFRDSKAERFRGIHVDDQLDFH